MEMSAVMIFMLNSLNVQIQQGKNEIMMFLLDYFIILFLVILLL